MSSISREKLDAFSKSLSHSQLFHEQPEQVLKSLIEKGSIKEFKAGQIVVEEEHRVDGLHVILEGSARVQKGTTLVTTLGRGAFFGEISLFGASFGATASIVGHDSGTMLVVSKTGLSEWSKQYPESERIFLRKLCTELCRRLYMTSDRMK